MTPGLCLSPSQHGVKMLHRVTDMHGPSQAHAATCYKGWTCRNSTPGSFCSRIKRRSRADPRPCFALSAHVSQTHCYTTHLGQQLGDPRFSGRVTGVFHELQIQAFAPRLLEIPSRAGLTS